ncbi:hypothetical protein ER308_07180 [Egibacter rhizosphaerae]|uniref:Uncharacterized protein n=1 Tax=Egibacter rhizosphaerae TaxID=1670831 RepID=A0A411YDS0_9ACTN|nr:hypothetical protein [Egibacter rhizosphaerae]QBI19348.1 hypothetical protein ER308_07180 [Egibacter rhizosphaerae]
MGDEQTAQAQDGGGDNEPQTDENGNIVISREAFDNLRSAANRREDTQRVKRENFLLKKGVDPEGETGQMLMGIEGEIPDQLVDQLAAQGQQATQVEGSEGSGGEESQSEGPELSDSERQSTEIRQGVASGTSPEGDNQADPYEQIIGQANEQITQGATREDAVGNAIGAVIASDDPRTIAQTSEPVE